MEFAALSRSACDCCRLASSGASIVRPSVAFEGPKRISEDASETVAPLSKPGTPCPPPGGALHHSGGFSNFGATNRGPDGEDEETRDWVCPDDSRLPDERSLRSSAAKSGNGEFQCVDHDREGMRGIDGADEHQSGHVRLGKPDRFGGDGNDSLAVAGGSRVTVLGGVGSWACIQATSTALSSSGSERVRIAERQRVGA